MSLFPLREGVTPTPIQGISLKYVEAKRNSYYIIESDRVLRTLNSSMWGEGLGWHQALLNRQVDKSYMSDDPLSEMHVFMGTKGICIKDTAALLTAARVRDCGYSDITTERGLRVCTWATVGLSNKARAGRDLPLHSLYPGTINIIVVIDGELTDAAMVNAVITATEAKVAALQDSHIRIDNSQDEYATGTTTDAVLIAATQRGPLFRYAGTSTEVGHLIGRTVYQSVMASTSSYVRWVSHSR